MLRPAFVDGIEVRGTRLVRTRTNPGSGSFTVFVFNVADTSGFRLKVRVHAAPHEKLYFGIGITPLLLEIGSPGHKLPAEQNNYQEQGYFLDFYEDDDDANIDLRAMDGTWGAEPPATLRRMPGRERTVSLEYSSHPAPTLCFAIEDGPLTPVRFNNKLPKAEFRPCVTINNTATILEVVSISSSESSSIRKRKREDRLIDGSRRLWESCRFADAEILCAGRAFSVHRAVLCAKSRAFLALFEGGGKEASSAKVDMTGEDPGAVAALLEHAYTAELPAGADPLVLLPLADRYELFDCVDDCAEQLVGLAADRPADVLRALRPYAGDERLKPVWERCCRVIRTDPALCDAAFKGL